MCLCPYSLAFRHRVSVIVLSVFRHIHAYRFQLRCSHDMFHIVPAIQRDVCPPRRTLRPAFLHE